MADKSDDERNTDWLQAELEQSFDEDQELEFDDTLLSKKVAEIYKREHGATINRREYFRHLLSLQRELIKLQTWAVNAGAKIVVLFEGRDSAGKGGAIKRVTQRLNPRVCRVVATRAQRA